MTLKEQIEKIVKGESSEENIPMTPIRDIEEILLDLGYDDLELDGEELNGWQVDFVYKFTHPVECGLTLSGSLHYGGFKIYETEKQDEE